MGESAAQDWFTWDRSRILSMRVKLRVDSESCSFRMRRDVFTQPRSLSAV